MHLDTSIAMDSVLRAGALIGASSASSGDVLASPSQWVHPLLILAVGVGIVVGMILVFRMNAFISLIVAALAVSFLSPGDPADLITRVGVAFGSVAGSIGIVIAMAAIIGKCMMDSGAADRIVRAFCGLLGEKGMPTALLGSGFVLSVPVFFDTVFYLLIPLARSLYRRTGSNYALYLVATAAGAMITHNLVPPTPGPLFVAGELGVPIGMMMLVGGVIALIVAPIVLAGCYLINSYMTIPLRVVATEEVDVDEAASQRPAQLPPLGVALLPIVVPVVLISAATIHAMVWGPDGLYDTSVGRWIQWLGNKDIALILAAAISMATLVKMRGLTLIQLKDRVETALLSGGLIILITAAGGAFGGMLKISGVREFIENYFQGGDPAALGTTMMLVAFGIAAVLKASLGSSTVAGMTAATIMASMGLTGQMLGFSPVYIATAIGGGACIGAWMNDSGFWIYTKLGGLTEVESLKSWTVIHAIFGVSTIIVTYILSRVMPLV